MVASDLLVREYQSGDEAGILKLFATVFGIHRSVDYWNWQFTMNSQGKSWIILAETEGEIVAQYAMRHNDINCMGSRIIAGQSCDTMVRADQRNKKLFIRLAEENYARAANEGMKIVFGFPNRDSYPGFLRKLGWYKICALKYYYYRIGVQRFLGKRADRVVKCFLPFPNRVRYLVEQNLLGGDTSMTVSPEITQEGAAVLEEALDYEVLSIWKDLDYMKWRYENHPKYSYDFHVISVNGRPEGLAVCRDCGETIAICELIHRTKNIRQSVLLIRRLVAYYSHSAAQKVEFSGYDDGFFDAVFASSGFNASPSPALFAARAFDDEKLERILMIPNNWTVSLGDSDVI
jgi:hypothetical protein